MKQGDRPGNATVVFLLAAFLTLSIVPAITHAAVSAEMNRLLNSIMSYEYGQSRVDLITVETGIRDVLDDAGALRDIENRFIDMLESDSATYDCKDFICRQLWIMGSDQSIPVLSGMLLDEDYSNMARYALERNESSRAGDALRSAMNRADGTILIGIINTLGERGDERAVDAIAAQVTGEDEAVALAAIDALGKIGGDTAMSALAQARRDGSPSVNRAAANALLRLADEQLAE